MPSSERKKEKKSSLTHILPFHHIVIIFDTVPFFLFSQYIYKHNNIDSMEYRRKNTFFSSVRIFFFVPTSIEHRRHFCQKSHKSIET